MKTSIQDSETFHRKTHYYYLDLFRGLAALLVLLEHTRNFLWVDYQEVTHHNIATKLIYFVSGLGHEAVMIFFVLSGCVVGRITIDALRDREKWQWREYLFARLSRLWIVLVPALLLTWIMDGISLNIAPAHSFVFHGGQYAHMASDQILQDRLHPSYFIGNVAFFQTILLPTFGSNGVLWSLANEFWYYMIFPLLLFGLAGWQRPLLRLAFVLGSLAALFTFGPIAKDFPIWLIGAFAYYMGTKIRKRGLALAGFSVGALLTIVSVALSRLMILDGAASSYAVGITTGITVAFSLYISMPGWLKTPSQWLSGFSFSLYIIHAPILTLFVASWIANNSERLQPTSSTILLLFGVIIVLYSLSWLFYLAVEHHTSAIRQYIRSKIGFALRSPVKP